MDQKKIGCFLKELRNEKGITQEQAANEFGVTQRTVSRWETGSNMPDLSILIEIAEFYDVDIREIINGERKSEDMNKETKETLEMVANYTDVEKEKFINQTLKYGISAFVCAVIALLFVILGSYSQSTIWENFIDFLGFVESFCTACIVFNCLRLKDMMSKNRKKK